MNVRINLAGLKDEKFKSSLQEKLRQNRAESDSEFKRIIQVVEGKIG
jgi:formiminotetrahydrofolate cyclodeaminase